MKTTKEPSAVEVHKNEGINRGTVIMITFVSLLVGFILGATVAILKTQPGVAPIPAAMVGPTVEESGKDVTADYEEKSDTQKSKGNRS